MDLKDLELLVQESGSMQKPAELWMLIRFLKTQKIKSILEIGIMSGGTTSILKICFSKATVIGVDCQNSAIIEENRNRFGFTFIQGDSREEETVEEVLKLLPKKFIDFIFIDGAHGYENVKRDFELWYPYGKLVALYDIQQNFSNPQDEVHLLWKDLEKEYKTKEFCVPDGWGGIGLILEEYKKRHE